MLANAERVRERSDEPNAKGRRHATSERHLAGDGFRGAVRGGEASEHGPQAEAQQRGDH